jgi:hypothetical protein
MTVITNSLAKPRSYNYTNHWIIKIKYIPVLILWGLIFFLNYSYIQRAICYLTERTVDVPCEGKYAHSVQWNNGCVRLEFCVAWHHWVTECRLHSNRAGVVCICHWVLDSQATSASQISVVSSVCFYKHVQHKEQVIYQRHWK